MPVKGLRLLLIGCLIPVLTRARCATQSSQNASHHSDHSQLKAWGSISGPTTNAPVTLTNCGQPCMPSRIARGKQTCSNNLTCFKTDSGAVCGGPKCCMPGYEDFNPETGACDPGTPASSPTEEIGDAESEASEAPCTRIAVESQDVNGLSMTEALGRNTSSYGSLHAETESNDNTGKGYQKRAPATDNSKHASRTTTGKRKYKVQKTDPPTVNFLNPPSPKNGSSKHRRWKRKMNPIVLKQHQQSARKKRCHRWHKSRNWIMHYRRDINGKGLPAQEDGPSHGDRDNTKRGSRDWRRHYRRNINGEVSVHGNGFSRGGKDSIESGSRDWRKHYRRKNNGKGQSAHGNGLYRDCTKGRGRDWRKHYRRNIDGKGLPAQENGSSYGDRDNTKSRDRDWRKHYRPNINKQGPFAHGNGLPHRGRDSTKSGGRDWRRHYRQNINRKGHSAHGNRFIERGPSPHGNRSTHGDRDIAKGGARDWGDWSRHYRRNINGKGLSGNGNGISHGGRPRKKSGRKDWNRYYRRTMNGQEPPVLKN